MHSSQEEEDIFLSSIDKIINIILLITYFLKIFKKNISGYSSFWSRPQKYFGGDPKNASAFHFPGLDVETAKWLANEIKVILYIRLFLLH